MTFDVFSFIDIKSEINRTQDAITKLLLNDIFERHALHLHDLVEAIDQMIVRDRWIETALGEVLLQSRGDRQIQWQKIRQLLRLMLRCCGLAIKQ